MKTETKHTPGNWRVVISGVGLSVDCGAMTIACVNGAGGETKANARLIAAAPELLEAAKRVEPILERLVDRFSEDSELTESFLQIAAAIAKANGR